MDRLIKNTAWLSLIALLEAIQLLILLSIIFTFVPIKLDALALTFFPLHLKGLLPEREMFLYRAFIVMAVVIQAGLVLIFRRTLHEEYWVSRWRQWSAVSAVLVLVQCYCVTRVWLDPNPMPASYALYGITALAYGFKIFWPEFHHCLEWANGRFKNAGGFLRLPNLDWSRHKNACVIVLLTAAFGTQAYFAAGLAGAIAGAGASAVFFRYLPSGSISRMGLFTGVEALITFFILAAQFKIQVYHYEPRLAQHAFHFLMLLAVINKLAWPFIERFLRAAYAVYMDEKNSALIKGAAHVLFVLFIFLFLYVPDLESAIARMFMGEQFHHVDACLMNTAWAYHAGAKLNIDVNNRYGFGIAVFTSALTNILGGFSYLNVYTIVMFACIVYFIAAYGFLRVWLNNAALAIAGILIAFKMLPFKNETSSIYLTNPSTTGCRYFFDIPFFFMVLFFLRTGKRIFLAIAAFLSGIALFYVNDTGPYLFAVFYAFLAFILFIKETRELVYVKAKDMLFLGLTALIPPFTAFIFLYLTQGSGVMTISFWQRVTEYVQIMIWYGAVPLSDPLKEGDIWVALMGVWFPLAYVFTMILTGSLVYLKKLSRENLVVPLLCVYGLMLYHYYINRSTPTNCYVGILPYIFICCFWFKQWADRLASGTRKKFYLVLLFVCFYALMTTHLTLAYPNVFNFSRNPSVDTMVAPKLSKGKLGYYNQLFIQYPDAFKMPFNSLGEKAEAWKTEDDFKTDEELKAYFRKEFNFAEDAALMTGLTKPDEPVALISSFEIQMLIQAKRKPFFYIFPLINSRPMYMRLFEVTHMWTTTQLARTIGQLESSKPPFVFMERIYLANEMPQAYLYDMPGLFDLINYVRTHYEPYAVGKYLVAMKRSKQEPSP